MKTTKEKNIYAHQLILDGQKQTCSNCGFPIMVTDDQEEELKKTLPYKTEKENCENLTFFCSSYDEKNHGVCNGERAEEVEEENDYLPQWEDRGEGGIKDDLLRNFSGK